MKKIIFICLFISLVSMLLSVYSLIQQPVLKFPTEQSLVVIEKNLTTEQRSFLKEHLNIISYNQKAFQTTRFNLWITSIIGFFVVSIVSFVIAILIVKRPNII